MAAAPYFEWHRHLVATRAEIAVEGLSALLVATHACVRVCVWGGGEGGAGVLTKSNLLKSA